MLETLEKSLNQLIILRSELQLESLKQQSDEKSIITKTLYSLELERDIANVEIVLKNIKDRINDNIPL